MNHAIEIIKADMKLFINLGYDATTYDSYFVVVALEEAGIDPKSLPVSPTGLLLAAYEDLLKGALEQ